MKREDVRTCSICDRTIPRGEPFRSEWTTPSAVSGGDPLTRPSFVLEVDGTSRLTICRDCAEGDEKLLATTTETVDPLH